MTSRASLVVIALVLLAAGVHAKTYVDTKKRFSLDMPSGWSLAPMPGDTTGMIFKKVVDGIPGILRVTVRPLTAGETPKATLDGFEAPFHDEIGFHPGADVPSNIGLQPATRRTFSVYASGDAQTVRAIEVHVLHSFGFAHVLHFETVEKTRSAFSRDLDRIIGTYEALAGKGTLGPLVGKWVDKGGGPDMTLSEDNRFSLGPLVGTFRADAGRLTLRVPGGEEGYRYTLTDNVLTLTSSNLDEPKRYVRQGAARFSAGEEKPMAGPLTRDQLLGRWRVVDASSTEALVLQLAPSGSVAFGPMAGRWTYNQGRLTITSTAAVTITYAASMTQGKLNLEGGDLEAPLTFVRDGK